MNSITKLYLERAENELKLSKIIFEISTNCNMKEDIFKIKSEETFFSAVISHSYYTIFYCAKAYLSENNIKTNPPEEHSKTYKEFKIIVEQGKLDLELLTFYNKLFSKSEELLEIFKVEKNKRGEFTYKKLPQAQKNPSKNSLNNAIIFFKTIYNILE